MKRTRTLGLCLVAAFAFGALMSASAFGVPPEPQVGRCLAHPGGKWQNSSCTVEKAGELKFEWYPATGKAANGEEKPIVKPKYKSQDKNETLIQLESVKEEKIICKGTNGLGLEGQTAEGEVTGLKTNRAFNIIFRGCEASGLKCKSVITVEELNKEKLPVTKKATKEGEIVVNELNGSLGIEKVTIVEGKEVAAKNKVANLFVPTKLSESKVFSGETGLHEIYTQFECGVIPVVVRTNPANEGTSHIGGVLNPVTADKMLKSATVKFSATKGKQKPEKFATDPAGTKRVLFAKKSIEGSLLQNGQTLTTIQTNEEPLEINTVL